jgi:lipopolysaccharide O-acetyltransferase
MTKWKCYSILQLLGLVICIIRTKFFFSKARLIRFPIDVRGKQHIDIGKQLTTGKYCRLEAYPKNNQRKVLLFGENVQINDFVHITAMGLVKIGNNVLIASKVYISDCAHGEYNENESTSPEIPPIKRNYDIKLVIIEDNVWIGESVSILPGVCIGKGSIIGANSVVTRNIPPHVIAVGIPAKPIKHYNFENKKWEKI